MWVSHAKTIYPTNVHCLGISVSHTHRKPKPILLIQEKKLLVILIAIFVMSQLGVEVVFKENKIQFSHQEAKLYLSTGLQDSAQNQ